MTGSWTWARTAPQALQRRGLRDVDAELDVELVNGGSPTGLFWRLALEQVGGRLVEAGIAGSSDVSRALELLVQDDFWTPMIAMVCAWGRKSQEA